MNAVLPWSQGRAVRGGLWTVEVFLEVRLRVLRPKGGLLMTQKPVAVRVFVAPDASCGHGVTWSAASAIVRDHLQRRFGTAIAAEQIEIFSPRSCEFPETMAAIEAGARLPLVTVDDRIVSEGGKLSERIIREAVERRIIDSQ